MAVTDRKPSGVTRLLLRAPIWLYRARLGRLAGHRLLYIAHRGRNSGARREVVVETVAYDPAVPEVVAVAAWGPRPDWYLNLRAAPALEVRIGAHRWERPAHRPLGGEEAAGVLRAYRRAHPRAWKRVAPVLGFPAEPDEEAWARLAGSVRALAFRPATPFRPVTAPRDPADGPP